MVFTLSHFFLCLSNYLCIVVVSLFRILWPVSHFFPTPPPYPTFCSIRIDTKVVDKKKITRTDVDLTFTKVKTKGERKIGFKQFLEGIQHLALKAYPKDDAAFSKVTFVFCLFHFFSSFFFFPIVYIRCCWLYYLTIPLYPLQLVARIVASGGPTSSGTKADKVKFHDDKSTYTGVYKQGGPSTVDSPGVTLEKHLDRSPADARGVKK